MTIKASFIGANPNPRVVGEKMMEYKCNYFIGNDPTRWRTDVPNYESITLRDIYEGVDLRFSSGGDGRLTYQYELSSGADISKVELSYEDTESVVIDGGRAVANTKWGEISGLLAAPADVSTLSDGTSSQPIVSAGVRAGVLDYGGSRGMTLEYSTYLGGSNDDCGYGIAIDASGCAYVIGQTESSDFPAENAWDNNYNGGDDVFVTKFSAAGSSLLYSTFLGGSGSDYSEAIAIDASGCAYVTGGTYSSDFPTENAWDDSYHDDYGDYGDVFVTKLSAAGNSLLYSTYLGGLVLKTALVLLLTVPAVPM